MSDKPTAAMVHGKRHQEIEIRLAIFQTVTGLASNLSRSGELLAPAQTLKQCKEIEKWILGEPKVAKDPGEISDGYHTFSELYAARHILFVNVCLMSPNIAFWTHRSKEGEVMDGWFILGLQSSNEQLTFHLPVEYLHYVKGVIKEVERNKLYDDHGGVEVLERLKIVADNTRHGLSELSGE